MESTEVANKATNKAYVTTRQYSPTIMSKVHKALPVVIDSLSEVDGYVENRDEVVLAVETIYESIRAGSFCDLNSKTDSLGLWSQLIGRLGVAVHRHTNGVSGKFFYGDFDHVTAVAKQLSNLSAALAEVTSIYADMCTEVGEMSKHCATVESQTRAS